MVTLKYSLEVKNIYCLKKALILLLLGWLPASDVRMCAGDRINTAASRATTKRQTLLHAVSLQGALFGLRCVCSRTLSP